MLDVFTKRLKDVLLNLSLRYIKVILRCLEEVLKQMTYRWLIKRCLEGVL